jgi:uncharacterized repeat protein (TIGR02543 family)
MPASTTLSIYNKETQKEFTISSSTFADNDGYKFLGWNTDKNAITSNYSPGSKIIITSTEVSKTLYAIWEKTITLQYNKNGRGVVPNAQE